MTTPKPVSSLRPLTLPLLAALAVLSIAGCNKTPDDSPASQVAVKVNGAEITVHQVNQMLTKAGNIPPAQQDQVRKNVLDNLINQQLLAAKALDAKLDRTPETLMAIEAAKREILARAYIDKVLAAAPKLDAKDVPRYYFDHPELFAERKVYNLQEITFQLPEDQLTPIKEMAHVNAPTEKIVEYLKRQNIPFRGNAVTRPAEQIPAEILKQLDVAKDGDSTLINSPQGRTLLRLVSARKIPVDENTAVPAIQRFLVNQRAKEVSEKELKALRDTAKIEYLGTFAEVSKPTQAAEAPQPAAPATKALAEPPQNAPTGVLTQRANGQITLPPLPHEMPNTGGIPATTTEK